MGCVVHAHKLYPNYTQLYRRENIPGVAMKDLSMGMSHDFEIAIEEGATIGRDCHIRGKAEEMACRVSERSRPRCDEGEE